MRPLLPPSDAFAAAILLLASHCPERPVSRAVETAGLDAEAFERRFRLETGVELARFLELLPLADGRDGLTHPRPQPAAAPAIPEMSPRRTYAGLVLRWGRHHTPFGSVLAAACEAGLCRLGFDGDDPDGPAGLARDWPDARLEEDPAATRSAVDHAFSSAPRDQAPPLPLALRGTPFQLAVWQALTAIPFGAVVSYQDIAAAVDRPKSARAVGGAVGANPIAVLVPCHRVISASGALHHYGWGPPLKRALLAWERAHTMAGDKSP